MPTFDIVSEINKVEVANAVDNANRELATRFDFRGVEASFELVGETVEIVGEGEFQLKQMMD
ncbi:MAG TPA: YajQ family cyclic di-GMP-binding protein, partial [Glaciecola sp.]|nr:YajQ family cyclic di-GMP-binding protein [Glaciecola sp.]